MFVSLPHSRLSWQSRTSLVTSSSSDTIESPELQETPESADSGLGRNTPKNKFDLEAYKKLKTTSKSTCDTSAKTYAVDSNANVDVTKLYADLLKTGLIPSKKSEKPKDTDTRGCLTQHIIN